jgi:hypothetical protein
MAPVRDPSDDELVRLLRGEALQVDAPEHVVRRALGAFRRRDRRHAPACWSGWSPC